MLESICPSGQPIEHGSVPRTILEATEGREMVGVVGDAESTVGEPNTCGIPTPTENVEAEPNGLRFHILQKYLRRFFMLE